MATRQIIGSFDMVMTYDDELVGDAEIRKLMEDIQSDVMEQYENVLDLFTPSEVTDSDIVQLHALMKVAQQRFIDEQHPIALINAYLNENELNQYYDVAKRLKGRYWK